MSGSPIIIVTGANSGVGLGTCQRLLQQLAETSPSDAIPRFEAAPGSPRPLEIQPCDALTLIMACRSPKRAQVARETLYQSLDAHIEVLKKQPQYDGHAERFKANLKIHIHSLDLASMQSVFKFGNEMSKRYPYISHVIFNAGVATFTGINWPLAIYQVLTDFMVSVSRPIYYMQSNGEMSADGLGWTWQCNVFGHYSLYRMLQPLLLANQSPLGPRVLWTGSLEATPKHHDLSDWQVIKTEHPYEASKYQIDLIATEIARRGEISKSPIRHIIVEPGFSFSNIANALTGWILDWFKLAAFYLARWLGSRHHTIHPINAAISGTHVILAPLQCIPKDMPHAAKPDSMQEKLNGSTVKGGANSPRRRPARIGAQTNTSGDPFVGLTEVVEWESYAGDASILVDRCEALYQKFWEEEGAPLVDAAPVDVEAMRLTTDAPYIN